MASTNVMSRPWSSNETVTSPVIFDQVTNDQSILTDFRDRKISKVTSAYDKVRGVICKSPDRRMDYEITELIPWFRKNFNIFNNLSSDALLDIIKHAQFAVKKTDEIIIRKGEKADCMYILLRGKVTVYNQYEKTEKEERPPVFQTQTISKSAQIRHALGTFVTHIHPGSMFGEVALMSSDEIRSASIIAEEWSELIVIHRDLYNRSVKQVLEQEFVDKWNFVNENQYFQKMSPDHRKQMVMAMQKKLVPYDSMLQRQGDAVDAIYYILNGEIKVCMDPRQHRSQYAKLFSTPLSDFSIDPPLTNLEINDDGNVKRTDTFRTHDKLRRHLESTSLSVTGSNIFIPRRQPIEISLLGKNESLGDVEVLLGLNSYMQTTISSQKTEVLVLELKHFERLLVKRNHGVVDNMCLGLEVRLMSSARISPTIEKSIPLLGRLRTAAAGKIRSKSGVVRREQKPRQTDGGKSAGIGTRRGQEKRAAAAEMATADSGKHAGTGSRLLNRDQVEQPTPKVPPENEDRTDHLYEYDDEDSDPSLRDADNLLTDLEFRMKSWLNKLNSNNPNEGNYRVEKLRRAETTVSQLMRRGAKLTRCKSRRNPFSAPRMNVTNESYIDILSQKNNVSNRLRLQYYRLALSSAIPRFGEILNESNSQPFMA